MLWPLSQELSPSHTHTAAWGAGDKWLWDSLSAINKPLAADEWDRAAALRFYFTSLHLLRFGSFGRSRLVSSLILFPSALCYTFLISLVSHCVFVFLPQLVVQSHLVYLTSGLLFLCRVSNVFNLSPLIFSRLCSHYQFFHLFLLSFPRLSSPLIFLITLSSFFSFFSFYCFISLCKFVFLFSLIYFSLLICSRLIFYSHVRFVSHLSHLISFYLTLIVWSCWRWIRRWTVVAFCLWMKIRLVPVFDIGLTLS